ncbi:MAG: zinc metalloprotease HtpX [Dehalococcoidia bacterium]|jgi:heat shock protein HtpX|nr:zinc metalloprotease HtpX [Dehalococcoidia bacterium]
MNTLKTGFLMIVLSVLLVLAGYFMGGTGGMFIALVLSLGMNFFAYWSSDKLALRMTGAKEVFQEDAPDLHFIVEEQARLSNLPKPKVYVIENDSPNAFATGRNPSHAAVAATTGIMRILSRDELSAVLAHEMAHVGNRDTLIMTVVAAIAGAITLLAMIARWSMLFGGRRGGGGMVGIVGLLAVAILLPLAAVLVRAAISRSREYQADSTGARSCRSPWALADALEKLEKEALRKPMKVNEAVSHLFIVNPLSGFSATMFSTHPPMQKRIGRLREMRRY